MDEVLKVYEWHRGRGDLDALPQWTNTLIKLLLEEVEGSLSAKSVAKAWERIEELAGTLSVLKDEVSNFSGDQQHLPDPDGREVTIKDVRDSVGAAIEELEAVKSALVETKTRAPGLDAVLQMLKQWPADRAHHMLGFVMQVWDKGGGTLVVRFSEGATPSIAMDPGTSSDNAVLLHALSRNAVWLSVWRPMLGGYIAAD